jgi:CBS domain-containing protein
MDCPFCAHQNIDGSDHCDQCGQPLGDLHLSAPRTFVERGLMTDRVTELNPRIPIVIPGTASVRVALETLTKHGIGSVLVSDEQGNVVGILSERDCVVRLGPDFGKLLDRPVSEFMTIGPQTLPSDAKVAFAVQRMDVGGYRHLPLRGPSGAVAGVISVRDILNYLTDRMPMSSD